MINGERIPTPVDDRGLVDHKNLIKYAVDHSPPERLTTRDDAHHTYWFVQSVMTDEHDSELVAEYRDLPINKILMPSGLHREIHRLTEPPPIPPNQIMEYRVEAWRIASKLFDAVTSFEKKNQITIDREEDVELEWMLEQRLLNFRDYNMFEEKLENIEKLKDDIPVEYRLDDENFAFGFIKVMREVARKKNPSVSSSKNCLSLDILGVELQAA